MQHMEILPLAVKKKKGWLLVLDTPLSLPQAGHGFVIFLCCAESVKLYHHICFLFIWRLDLTT